VLWQESHGALSRRIMDILRRTMDLNEILNQLPKLSDDERRSFGT
jgi:hypothetical protein